MKHLHFFQHIGWADRGILAFCAVAFLLVMASVVISKKEDK